MRPLHLMAFALGAVISGHALADPQSNATGEPGTAAHPPNTGPVVVERVQTPERALVFSVTLPASLDDTWEALSSRAGLETWLWRDARVDLRAGGDWLALFPGGKTAGGTIVAFEVKRRLELRALAPEKFPTVREQRTKVVFELQSLGEASTRLTLRQTGWRQGQEWDEAYDYLAVGNAQLLNQLYVRFARGPIVWPSGAR